MNKSKADQSRLDAIHNMPCLCCESMKMPQPFPTEAHHWVANGYRRLSGGHSSTINLCSFHHRGVCLDGLTAGEMTDIYGPSLALNKRQFIITFGTEADLLAKTNSMLKELQNGSAYAN